MKVSHEAVAMARASGTKLKALKPWTVPVPMPGVLPANEPATIAQDWGGLYEQAGAYGLGSLQGEGLAWLGYPYLAELAQRPEYRRISETLAREMTRQWVKLTAKGEEDKSDKLAVLDAAMTKFRVQEAFRRGAELDGFFGRGQVYIDTGATNNPDELATPLTVDPRKIRTGGLKGLKVIEPVWTYASGYDTANPLSEHFYRPQAWFVMGKKLHRSRLLTFIGRELPDLLKPAYGFSGLSMSQMARPYVDNWIRTRQSVSDLLHSFSVSGIKTDMEAVLAGGGGQDMLNRIEMFNAYRDNGGMMLLNQATEEFFNVATPLGTLDHLQAQAQEQMASVSGIPLVKLLGITPSGLNACLPGDTMIATDRGQVKIRDVTTNDLVLTRKGWAPLTFSGVTKYAKELIEIKTANKTLLCTGNHPIWLPEVGEFVPAENVLRGDCLLLIGEKLNAQNMHCPWHGAVNGGGDAQTAITQRGMQKHAAHLCSIGKFGKRITARCQRVAIFITETAIRLTTSLTILSPCQRGLMLNFTTLTATFDLALERIALSPSAVPNAEAISPSTNYRAGKSFVLKNAFWQTEGRRGRLRPSQSQYVNAPNAGQLSQLVAKTRNFVRVNAQLLAKIAQHTLAHIILPIRTNMCAPKRANSDEGLVVGVKRVPASEWVYDLTVEPGHLPEFFANGILTHNSSDGEVRVFYDSIAAYQEHLFRPHLKRVLDIIQLSELGEIDPDISFTFNPLWEVNEKEIADIREINSRVDIAYAEAGVLAPEDIRATLAAEGEGRYSAVDLSGPPPEPPEPDDGNPFGTGFGDPETLEKAGEGGE